MALLDPRKRWMADSGVVWYRAENESQTRVIDCSIKAKEMPLQLSAGQPRIGAARCRTRLLVSVRCLR